MMASTSLISASAAASSSAGVGAVVDERVVLAPDDPAPDDPAPDEPTPDFANTDVAGNELVAPAGWVVVGEAFAVDPVVSVEPVVLAIEFET
jgi:hypothetical protein